MADALASGASARKGVEVQLLSRAHTIEPRTGNACVLGSRRVKCVDECEASVNTAGIPGPAGVFFPCLYIENTLLSFSEFLHGDGVALRSKARPAAQ